MSVDDVVVPPASALLVDDRPENLLALEAVLEPLGIGLVRAASGEDALRSLLTDDFSVIILDVQMPGLDGFETARHIKARERTRHIPIIFLTALSTELDHAIEGYETGAIDYVLKPFAPEVLRAKVSVLVELRQQSRLIEMQKELLALRLVERDKAQAALTAQAAELERSNAELERFATMVSHDVSEPLHVVAGFLDLLRTRYGNDLAEPALSLLDHAQGGTRRLFTLLDALLEYATASTGVRASETVALEDIVHEACEQLADAIATSGATITTDPLPDVVGDRWQLVLLFAKLIDNAISYAREVQPEVHVGLTRREGSWVLSVRDNGIGIGVEELPQLFTIFSRAGASAGGGGTGLGLSVARRVVERHGGSIWAESLPGRGTTISFTLPDRGPGGEDRP